MKPVNNEIKIALVAVTGIAILYLGMQFLKGSHLFSNDNVYVMKFNDISGLSSSSPIYANGYPVGSVKEVNYDYEHPGEIAVEVAVDKNMRIPDGSRAEIVSDMLGNVKVNLVLADDRSHFLNPGGVIDGRASAGALDDLKAMIPSVQRMLPKLDSIMCSLNAILADPAIAGTLHNAQRITSDLTTSTRELNQLMAVLNQNMPGMMNKANRVLENTSQLTASLNTKVAAFDLQGTQAAVQQTLTGVQQTLAGVQDFTDQLNSNQGSLGLLMRDPTLYNNLNATMSSADSLLINFREHPKRYVHFSIFGKKDK